MTSDYERMCDATQEYAGICDRVTGYSVGTESFFDNVLPGVLHFLPVVLIFLGVVLGTLLLVFLWKKIHN